MRWLPAGLQAMRGLAVLAVVFAAAAAYTKADYRYHHVFAGAALGVALVLAVLLFRAPAPEVQTMQHENENKLDAQK